MRRSRISSTWPRLTSYIEAATSPVELRTSAFSVTTTPCSITGLDASWQAVKNKEVKLIKSNIRMINIGFRVSDQLA